MFATKQGVLAGPVKTPSGYYIFQVQTITPGSQQTLTRAEAAIRSQLTATRQQSALSEFRQGIQEALDREHRVPNGLRGSGLQAVQVTGDTHRASRRPNSVKATRRANQDSSSAAQCLLNLALFDGGSARHYAWRSMTRSASTAPMNGVKHSAAMCASSDEI